MRIIYFFCFLILIPSVGAVTWSCHTYTYMELHTSNTWEGYILEYKDVLESIEYPGYVLDPVYKVTPIGSEYRSVYHAGDWILISEPTFTIQTNFIYSGYPVDVTFCVDTDAPLPTPTPTPTATPTATPTPGPTGTGEGTPIGTGTAGPTMSIPAPSETYIPEANYNPNQSGYLPNGTGFSQTLTGLGYCSQTNGNCDSGDFTKALRDWSVALWFLSFALLGWKCYAVRKA